jgi:purine catabolism regulator
VAVTVRDLLEVPDLPLRLLAGEPGIGRQVRWVHVSELEDPTPWLKGGEIVLTTGMGVGATPASQRAYVKRLAGAGLAGLGFGLGFSHERVPKAIVAAADRLDFPVFEVPFPVPFIAITEAIFTRILAEQYDTLQRAVDAEHVLTRAVMDGKGVEGIAGSLARVVRGWALLFDLHGGALTATSRAASLRAERVWEEIRSSRAEGTNFSITLVDRGHHVWVQPVGAQGHVEAFLAVGKPEQPSQYDRIVAAHALSLFAIELAKARAVADAQRRLQGDFFDELAAGSLAPAAAARDLARFGFDREGLVAAIALEGGDPNALATAAAEQCARDGGGFLVSTHPNGVLVLRPAGAADPGLLARAVGERLGSDVLAGGGGPATVMEVGRSLREARYALQVCRLEGRLSAGFEDLGSYRLLLSMADQGALRAFADSLLAPLVAYDREQGGDLIGSLQAFLHHNARWEAAAVELFVHRHTLRYRMRKVEELTGRDLASSFDRMEFWLALRARDLLSVDAE